MSRPPPRRPLFLSSLPPSQVLPVGFGSGTSAAPSRPPPRHGPGAPPAPATDPGPDVAQIRKEAFQKIAGAVEMLHVQAERLAEQARADAFEIGFLVARKILETEVRSSPEPLFALVKSALRRAGESRRVVIRLCPDDAAALHARKDGLAAGSLSSALIEIVPTADLEPGDCVVETDFGKIDGRLATRLEEVRRSVKSALEGDAA